MKILIKSVRARIGMTQAELAEKAGISRPYLTQLENGERTLNTKRQAHIADALGVDPSDLIDFSAPDMTDEEILLKAFRGMSPERRQGWLDMAAAVSAQKTAKKQP